MMDEADFYWFKPHIPLLNKSVTLLYVAVIVTVAPSDTQPVTFIPKRLCNDAATLCPDTALKLGRLLSRLDCARECRRDEECLGFSQPGQPSAAPRGLEASTCTIHHECLSVVDECQNASEGRVYMEKRQLSCHNGGVWMEDKGRCDCAETGGWVGRFCSLAPRTCLDLLTWGYAGSIHRVKRSLVPPLGPKTLDCALVRRADYSVVNTVAFHYADTGETIFDKPWEDYNNGIHERASFWIGMRHLKTMLDLFQGLSPSVTFVFAMQTDRVRFSYHGFSLSDSSDGYRLTYSSMEQDLRSGQPIPIADCLKSANNSRLSTLDVDNDDVAGQNCASRSRSGFWYAGSCRPLCNPFGVFYDSEEPEEFGYGPDPYSTYIWAGQCVRVQMVLRVEY